MSKTTDTNQASELFELCKKVYELTGWKWDYEHLMSRHWIYSFEGKTTGSYWEDVYDDYRNRDPFDDRRPTGITHRLERLAPLYTSDYLLEKLPKHVDYLSLNQNNKLTIDSSNGEKGKWYAHYWLRSRRLQVSSDTPLKALLELTIALSEAGELK